MYKSRSLDSRTEDDGEFSDDIAGDDDGAGITAEDDDDAGEDDEI